MTFENTPTDRYQNGRRAPGKTCKDVLEKSERGHDEIARRADRARDSAAR